MFLQYLLQQEEDSLLKKFFVAQMENPVKGDWILQAKKDLDEVNVDVDMEEIKIMSQENFKHKVKAAVNKAAFNYLSVEKARLSKIRDIHHEDL